jgi:hypothetical protein
MSIDKQPQVSATHALRGAHAIRSNPPMTAVQVVIVVGGSLLLLTLMTTLMSWANQRERRCMERRRAEWIAGGRVPEEEPKFYSGSSGGSGT